MGGRYDGRVVERMRRVEVRKMASSREEMSRTTPV